MVCYLFKFCKGCLPQVVLGPLLNTFFIRKQQYWEHRPKHDNSIPFNYIGRFIDNKCNLKIKKLYRTHQGFVFPRCSFSDRNNARALIQFSRESHSQDLKRMFFIKDVYILVSHHQHHSKDTVMVVLLMCNKTVK